MGQHPKFSTENKDLSKRKLARSTTKFQSGFPDHFYVIQMNWQKAQKIKLYYKQLKCFVFCQNMNGRKVRDVFVSCKCFSNFSEKPWLKLFEGHEMAFFYAAKVLLSLYEKRKKSFLSETFFLYFAKWFFLSELFFASSNESVSCLAVCWVVHSSKRE